MRLREATKTRSIAMISSLTLYMVFTTSIENFDVYLHAKNELHP